MKMMKEKHHNIFFFMFFLLPGHFRLTLLTSENLGKRIEGHCTMYFLSVVNHPVYDMAYK